MSFDNSAIYDMNDGLPIDKSYLECGLPKYLQESLDKMIQTWKIIDSGKKYLRFDDTVTRPVREKISARHPRRP